jgi:hypothetical protein
VKTSGAISSHSPSPVQRSWSIQTFMARVLLGRRRAGGGGWDASDPTTSD